MRVGPLGGIERNEAGSQSKRHPATDSTCARPWIPFAMIDDFTRRGFLRRLAMEVPLAGGESRCLELQAPTAPKDVAVKLLKAAGKAFGVSPFISSMNLSAPPLEYFS